MSRPADGRMPLFLRSLTSPRKDISALAAAALSGEFRMLVTSAITEPDQDDGLAVTADPALEQVERAEIGSAAADVGLGLHALEPVRRGMGSRSYLAKL